jgi:hypothetical protein
VVRNRRAIVVQKIGAPVKSVVPSPMDMPGQISSQVIDLPTGMTVLASLMVYKMGCRTVAPEAGRKVV